MTYLLYGGQDMVPFKYSTDLCRQNRHCTIKLRDCSLFIRNTDKRLYGPITLIMFIGRGKLPAHNTNVYDCSSGNGTPSA